MNVTQVVNKRETLYGRRVTVAGYLFTGSLFAYLTNSSAPDDQKPTSDCLLIPSSNLYEPVIEAGVSMKVGSTIMTACWAEVTGVLRPANGYFMFSAIFGNISDITLWNDDEPRRTIRINEPSYVLSLNPVTHLTIDQVQVLKSLIGGVENLTQLRTRLTDGTPHIIADDIPSAVLKAFLEHLTCVGLEASYAYIENRSDLNAV